MPVGEHEAARDRARLEAHLDYLAAELVAIVPLFSATGGSPQALPRERVARGKLTGGGQVLHFPDGQQPVSALRVRNADLHIAIEHLRRRVVLPV